MDLKDMILVTENDRGTETNMLMTLDDYKSFIAVDDMSELADNLLQLGRTLGEADNFAEYYRAANVTVSARFCLDDIQLGHFLQGFYNDSKEFRFDKEASSSECVAKLKEIGMTDKGWVDDFNLHYEMENRSFERGQTFHNFNDHDYMVLEALSPRNLVVMDMKSGSLTIALGATEYKRYPKDEKPTKDNTTIGVSWEHGIYLGSTLSTTNFKMCIRDSLKTLIIAVIGAVGVIILAKNVMEFAQAYQQQDSSTMNSALKGIVAGVMMAGISTVLTFLGF